MILSNARQLAEAIAEEPIKEVVLTVPPFWSQDERAALLDAAELAGMKVLALMHENTAGEKSPPFSAPPFSLAHMRARIVYTL